MSAAIAGNIWLSGCDGQPGIEQGFLKLAGGHYAPVVEAQARRLAAVEPDDRLVVGDQLAGAQGVVDRADRLDPAGHRGPQATLEADIAAAPSPWRDRARNRRSGAR